MKTVRPVSPAKPSTDTCTETGRTLTPTTPEESATGSASVRSMEMRAVGGLLNDVVLRGPIRG